MAKIAVEHDDVVAAAAACAGCAHAPLHLGALERILRPAAGRV